MGTSSSYPSPQTINWKAVSAGYKRSDVPIRRLISEIWRACEAQENPLSNLIKSDVLFKCQEVIRHSDNSTTALKNFTKEVIRSKQNSVIAELAKRALVVAMKSEDPPKMWRASLFSEITSYLVSRDVSGYVGRDYRNKTIEELRRFKEEIRTNVQTIAQRISVNPTTPEGWREAVQRIIATLGAME